MRRDITDLRDRVDAMDRQNTEMNVQVARLKTVLDEAKGLLGRNSADLGTKVAKGETDVAQIQGQIEEARHLVRALEARLQAQEARLAGIESTQGKIVERVAPTMPEDKEALWQSAQQHITGGRRPNARNFLHAFIERFPQDSRAAQAYLLVGQSFAVEGRHTQAAAEYSKLMEVYPKATEVPEGMWLLAESFAALKFCSDARAVLDDLLKRYPKSPRTESAKSKLRSLRRVQGNSVYCTS
jgi:TolA-binding protein